MVGVFGVGGTLGAWTSLLVSPPFRAAYDHWSLFLPEIGEIFFFMNKIHGMEGM